MEKPRQIGRLLAGIEAWQASDRAAEPSPAARERAAGRHDPTIAAEIDRFERAVERRLGVEGVAEALHSAREGGAFEVPGVRPEQRQAFAEAAREGRSDYETSIEQARQMQHERARRRHRRSLGLGR